MLQSHLKPIRSDARIYDLLRKGFFGRQWLFEAVEKWRLHAKLNSRLFWITGDPGVGKSAFAAQLTHTRSDAVVAAQFVEWDKADHRDARRVTSSLAFQLATRLPDYRKILLALPEIGKLDSKDPAELFDYLLANPLRNVIGGGRERYLIVIDALDEASDADRNPLVEMLARHASRLPEWLGLIVTSRPESDVKTPLQGMNPIVLDTHTDANRTDLCQYLQHNLAPQLHEHPESGRLVSQILEKSEGVFLYVERFCEEVQQGHLSLDRPEQFPQGLGSIFSQWFQRQFPDLEKFRKDVRPPLRAILAARESLRLKILQDLFQWQDEELRDSLRPLGSLFPITGVANYRVIKPYHKSIADWLVDEARAGEYFVSTKEGHIMLADYGWKEYLRGIDHMDTYFNRNLLDHLYSAGQYQRVVQCCEDGKMFLHRWKYPSMWVKVDDVATIVRDMVDGFPTEDTQRYAEALARSFGNVARGLRQTIDNCEQPLHLYADRTRKSDTTAFAEYRDSFYKFLYASTKAAIFASESILRDSSRAKFAQRLQIELQDVQQYHSYLTTASAKLGLSGKLDDEALELYSAWESLEALTQDVDEENAPDN
jgi:hypothetical protein